MEADECTEETSPNLIHNCCKKTESMASNTEKVIGKEVEQ